MADGGEDGVSRTDMEEMDEVRRGLYNEASITNGRSNQGSIRSTEHCNAAEKCKRTGERRCSMEDMTT